MALLLLRVSAALALLALIIYCPGIQVGIDLGLGFLALLIFVGLYTRIASVGCAAVTIIGFAEMGGRAGILLGLHALDIALLGAGAYSIDAMIFGRRVIQIED